MAPLGALQSVYEYNIADKPLVSHLLQSALEHTVGDLTVFADRNVVQESHFAPWGDSGRVTFTSQAPPEGVSDYPTLFTNEDQQIALRYPWDLLDLTEAITSQEPPRVAASAVIENGVELNGNIVVEEDAFIFSGARLKGNIYVGRGTVIGNNALIRGNVHFGANCVVGFGGEVKNSLLLDRVSVGPLAFVAESVVECDCFFGGVARVSNYRLDQGTVGYIAASGMIDTGRRRFGAVVGKGSSFGVSTVVLPGRSIGHDCIIDPAIVVRKNVPAGSHVKLVQTLDTTAREGP